MRLLRRPYGGVSSLYTSHRIVDAALPALPRGGTAHLTQYHMLVPVNVEACDFTNMCLLLTCPPRTWHSLTRNKVFALNTVLLFDICIPGSLISKSDQRFGANIHWLSQANTDLSTKTSPLRITAWLPNKQPPKQAFLNQAIRRSRETPLHRVTLPGYLGFACSVLPEVHFLAFHCRVSPPNSWRKARSHQGNKRI
jgi:hypothetical protein